MIGSGFNFYRTSRPASAAKPHSSLLNGRTLTSSFAASPRISRQSTWWAAVKQGGFAGWRQLIGRSMAEWNMTKADHSAKITQAQTDISVALKVTGMKPKEWRENFSQILRNAAWYEVDVEAQIGPSLKMMTPDELMALSKVCGSDSSLSFITNKIVARVAENGDFKDQLRGDFFKSAMLYCEGYLLEGSAQSKQWEKIDKLLVSYGNCHLEDNVANAIANSNLWELLPFAEHHRKQVHTTSLALVEFRRQAFEKIKHSRIEFHELSDKELGSFSDFFKDAELSDHASAYAAEVKKRLHTSRCNELELHLEKRVSSLIDSPIGSSGNGSSVPQDALFEELSDHAISIALNVIKKLDPEVVVKLSRLESENYADACLINAAKAYLAWPDVTTIEDRNLIAYLKLPNASFKGRARELLLQEAKDRTEKGLIKGFEILIDGLASNSCYELVHAVREFCTRVDNIEKIKDAAGLSKGWGELPAEFSTALEELDSNKIMRARVLIAGLVQHRQNHVANLLITAIEEKFNGAFVHPTSQYGPFMEKAIAHYFPVAGISVQSVLADPACLTLGPMLLGFFEDKCLVEGKFRKVRTLQGEEVPVCQDFFKDQRNSMHEVDNNPVFDSLLPKTHYKAREFVKKMSSMKKISEAQILTASRIATQATAQSFIELALKEKLFSLNVAESQKLNATATGGFLILNGLKHTENFVMQDSGNLIAHVRIFGENIKDWFGEVFTPAGIVSITPETIPEQTSVSVELKFEIDAEGKIKECIMESFTRNWAFATPSSF